jgi:hypothetical protein
MAFLAGAQRLDIELRRGCPAGSSLLFAAETTSLVNQAQASGPEWNGLLGNPGRYIQDLPDS